MEQQSTKAQTVFNEVVDDILLEEQAKAKFKHKKINGFYYIIDTGSGKKVGLHGKVFRSKGIKKLSETLFMLREAYKKQLKMEEEK